MQVDRVLGAVVMVLALGMVFIAIPNIPVPVSGVLGTGHDWIGPRFFPYITSTLCFLLGLMLAVRPGDEGTWTAQHSLGWRAALNVLLLALLSFLYVASMRMLGYPLSTGLVILAFLLLFGEYRVAIIVPFVIVVPIFMTLVFGRLLGISLPQGAVEIFW